MKMKIYHFMFVMLILSHSLIAFPQNREPACDTLFPPSCFYQADTGMMPLVVCPPIDPEYGYPLDFMEDWSSGNFDEHNWTVDGPNWDINSQEGNPSPTAEFRWDPMQINYNLGLESYPFLADSIYAGRIYLDFDLKLDDYASTGTEKLYVGIWDWDSQEWTALDSFSNANGSFDWLPVRIDISDNALGKVFKIKFSAKGETTLNILGWYIDNIQVYRVCEAPYNLDLTVLSEWESFRLTWEYPPGWDDQWIQWDDGVNYTSIGTAGPLEFDVAVRWEPDQLKYYPGAILKQVAFFPAESISTYSIRVWTGDEAQNMVIDQLVEEPVVDQWNFIDLNTPLPVDTSQTLWIGYHMNSVFGYPAGVDDGPAIDGYGNMINHYGWKTLLEMNPDLDYNFNIKAFIEIIDTNSVAQYFRIYRSDEGGPWFLRDTSNISYYNDDSVCTVTGKLVFTYKVKAICIEGIDSCESDYSNEVVEVCEGTDEVKNEPFLKIYPNPTSDFLSVESGEEIKLISLYSYHGRVLFRHEMADHTYILPVKDYPEGVYLLRIETGKGTFSKKVIILR